VVQSLPGILLLMFVAQLFWVIGIHGNQMIKPIREPLLLGAITVNMSAFEQGKESPRTAGRRTSAVGSPAGSAPPAPAAAAPPGRPHNQMIKPIREPLLLGAITVNMSAFEQGKEVPNIITTFISLRLVAIITAISRPMVSPEPPMLM
jgi:cellobiose-specific phosphotransferase system component IIC